MSKAKFVRKLAEDGKITKKQADEVFSAFVGMISTSLQNGERVALPGLGVFSVVDRKARKGRNPPDGHTDQDTGPEGGEVLRLQCIEHGPKRAEESPSEGASQERDRQTGKEEIGADHRGLSGSGRMLPSTLEEGFWTFFKGTVHQPK